MKKITKTYAAESMACSVQVWVRRTGQEPTPLMCQEIISNYLHPSYEGKVVQLEAQMANWRTVWSIVKAWYDQDRYSRY